MKKKKKIKDLDGLVLTGIHAQVPSFLYKMIAVDRIPVESVFGCTFPKCSITPDYHLVKDLDGLVLTGIHAQVLNAEKPYTLLPKPCTTLQPAF